MAVLPLTGRLIPIIADEYSDPEKGTGAVKITPGHDFNDFEVGKRHNLPLINILNKDGTLNDEVPAPYRGLKTARRRARRSSPIWKRWAARQDRAHHPCRAA